MIFGQATERERYTEEGKRDPRETFKLRENFGKLTLHCSGRVRRLADWQIVREEPQNESERKKERERVQLQAGLIAGRDLRKMAGKHAAHARVR